MPLAYKVFPPGHGHVHVPVGSRRDAAAALSLYTACRPMALGMQHVAAGVVRVAGPGMIPGRTLNMDTPLKIEAWRELARILRTEAGPFEAVAGLERPQITRGGSSLLLLRGGRGVAFVKIRPTEERELENEWDALHVIERMRPRSFVAPRPIAIGTVGGMRYLAMEAISTRVHRPFRGPSLTALTEELSEALVSRSPHGETPAQWRPMHGDLTPWNLRRSAGRTILLDWESAGWGPPGADPVLYMAVECALRKRQPARMPDSWQEAVAYWYQVWLRKTEAGAADNDPGRRTSLTLLEVLRGMGGPAAADEA